MNGASVALAKYVRDLLAQPEGAVTVLGRTNKPRGDTQNLQIVIDTLAPAEIQTGAEVFDGVAEEMTYCQLMRSTMTIDFMGTGAYDEAIRFIGLNRSQAAHDLKRALDIDIGLVKQLQDLKFLQGEQYSERYQLELTLTYNTATVVDTLRIDTAVVADPILVN